jgi:ketosteroid isomerase-like protein
MNETRKWLDITAIVVAGLGVAVSIVALLVALPVSTDSIRELIDREAVSVVDGDLDSAVLLYAEDAVIRDARSDPPEVWVGISEIRQRYRSLPRFLELAHVDKTVTVDAAGDFARVTASTVGAIVNTDGSSSRIHSVDGEVWSLRKIGGRWQVVSFSYNLY